MAGLNLSSSTGEKKEGKEEIIDRSLIIILSIFFFVIVSFGGLRFYIKILNDKLAVLDASLEQSSLELRGDRVDRVAHFDARLKIIEKQLKTAPVDSKSLLSQMESLIVPNVRLTKYEYNEKEKFVAVAGETENFKYVAEQIISLKSQDLFSGIRVDSLQRTNEGRIGFSLRAQF